MGDLNLDTYIDKDSIDDVEGENDINPFDEYSEYSKIESHLDFSRQLFLIDKKGKNILIQLELKKFERKKRNGGFIFKPDIDKVYTNLINILNVKKYRPRLYYTLQFYMDELLFNEVPKFNKFFIEDSEYDLTKVYFDQEAWISNQDIQDYQLDKGNDININEAMCFVCFLREFEDLLFSIQEYVNDLNEKRLKRIITKTITRIRYKHKIIWDIVVEIINKNLKHEN